MMKMDCKKCIHDPVCQLWRDQEKQDASCFAEEECYMGVKEALNWVKVTLDSRAKELKEKEKEIMKEKEELRKEKYPWGTR